MKDSAFIHGDLFFIDVSLQMPRVYYMRGTYIAHALLLALPGS